MVMAGDKNRDSDKHQRGDQAAPPPALFSLNPLFEPSKTPADVVVPFSSRARFFRHESRSPLGMPALPAIGSL
jgi:hypothetical protein